MKLHDLLKGLDIVSITGDLNIDITNIAQEKLKKIHYLYV